MKDLSDKNISYFDKPAAAFIYAEEIDGKVFVSSDDNGLVIEWAVAPDEFAVRVLCGAGYTEVGKMTEQEEKYVSISGGNGTLNIGRVIRLQRLGDNWQTFYERWEVLDWDTLPIYTWTGGEVNGELKYNFTVVTRVKLRKLSSGIEA